MKKLSNWKYEPLKNIAVICAGGDKPKSFSKNKTDINTIPVIANGEKNEGIYGYTNKPIIEQDSITISARGTIGYSCIRNYPYYPIVRLISIIPNKNIIDIIFLKYVFDILYEKGIGTSIPQLTIPMIADKKIPLPPLEEQKRIAKIIETKFNAVEKAKKANTAQTVNCALLKDKLYEKIFKKKKNEQVTIDSICDDISDGTHFTPTYVTHGIPFLSVKDLTKGYISFDNCRYIDIEEHKKLIKRCNPQYGDVLYTKVGTTGIAKAVDIRKDFSIFVSVALLKLKGNISPIFVEKSLNLPFCRKQADKLTQGATNKNLVIKDLKTIKLFCPEYSEQLKIVKAIEKIDNILNKLNIAINEQSTYINALPSSILRKAFNGAY